MDVLVCFYINTWVWIYYNLSFIFILYISLSFLENFITLIIIGKREGKENLIVVQEVPEKVLT